MGEARSTYGKERCMYGFGWEELMERYNLEDLGVDGKITVKWIFKKF